MRAIRFWLLAVLTAGSVGCGDDSGGGGGPVAIDDLPEALFATLCPQLERCGADVATYFGRPFDCAGGQAQFTNTDFALFDAAIDGGTVRYNGDRANACIAAIAAQGCEFDRVQRVPAVCREAVEGTIAEDGPCHTGAECTGESYCDTSGMTCPGACSPREPAGEICQDNDWCQDGLSCRDGMCGMLADAGDACNGEDDCAPGLLCGNMLVMDGSPGTCRALSALTTAAEGASCTPLMTLCQGALSCALLSITGGGGGADPVFDFECQQPVASGAACRVAIPDACPSGEFCAGTDPEAGMLMGTCTPLSTAGEACEGGHPLGSGCEAGLVCVSDVCREPQNNGETCVMDVECYSGRCATGMCAAPTCD